MQSVRICRGHVLFVELRRRRREGRQFDRRGRLLPQLCERGLQLSLERWRLEEPQGVHAVVRGSEISRPGARSQRAEAEQAAQ